MIMIKKISLALLLLAVAVSVAVACDNGEKPVDVTTDGTTTAEVTTAEATTEEVTTAAETEPPAPADENLYGWFEHGSSLVHRDKFEKSENNAVTMYMAKNEKEGVQYVLTSQVDYTGLRCEVSTLTDGSGNTLEGTVNVAWYTYIKVPDATHDKGFVPDAFLSQDNPYQGGTFDVKAGRSKTLYILYETDENTVPGTYTGKLEIKQGDNVLLTGDVSVTVWNLYYSEKTECITIFQYGYSPNSDGLLMVPGPASAPDMVADPKWEEIYCDYLLANRLGPYHLPVGENGIMDPKAAKYLDDPRVSMTFITEGQQKNLVLQYEESLLHEGWFDKIAFIQFDEPHEAWHLDHIKGGIKRIKNLFETTQHVNPFYLDMSSFGESTVDFLAKWSTVHCPKTPYFNDNVDAFMKLKERGDTILWYVCGDQPYDMIDILPCVPGTEKRVLYWQQYQNDVDGILYYHTTWWNGIDDIWAEGYEEAQQKPPSALDNPTGNGVMMFWDPLTGEPVPTFSLESMRDGVEDFQLMKMAEEVLGKEAVMEFVNRVSTSLTEYTTDAEVLHAARAELGNALNAAMAQEQ